MSINKSIALAQKAVKEGVEKYTKEGGHLSPDILKALLKAYAFDVLHHECDKKCEMNKEVDFHLFSSTVNKEIDAKLAIHFENPLA